MGKLSDVSVSSLLVELVSLVFLGFASPIPLVSLVALASLGDCVGFCLGVDFWWCHDSLFCRRGADNCLSFLPLSTPPTPTKVFARASFSVVGLKCCWLFCFAKCPIVCGRPPSCTSSCLPICRFPTTHQLVSPFQVHPSPCSSPVSKQPFC